MSVELVGYLLVGPRVLSPAALHAAEVKVQAAVAILASGDAEAMAELSEGIADLCADDEASMVADRVLADVPPAERNRAGTWLAQQVRGVWETGAQDTQSRWFGQDEQLFFTGGMTWGDPPQGWGYRIMALADLFDLFPVLGLR